MRVFNASAAFGLLGTTRSGYPETTSAARSTNSGGSSQESLKSTAGVTVPRSR